MCAQHAGATRGRARARVAGKRWQVHKRPTQAEQYSEAKRIAYDGHMHLHTCCGAGGRASARRARARERVRREPFLRFSNRNRSPAALLSFSHKHRPRQLLSISALSHQQHTVGVGIAAVVGQCGMPALGSRSRGVSRSNVRGCPRLLHAVRGACALLGACHLSISPLQSPPVGLFVGVFGWDWSPA